MWAGEAHNAPLFVICAIISGGLSGANFPMTAALVSDYYGENNNAVNYGSIYAFKALGGSFAGGVAALIMTGTLYGTAHFHWVFGFFFGAALGAIAALILQFLVQAADRGGDAGRRARGAGEGRGHESGGGLDRLIPLIVVDDPGRDGYASTTIMDRVSIRCPLASGGLPR